MVHTASNNDYTMNISNWVRKSSIAEMVAKLWRGYEIWYYPEQTIMHRKANEWVF